MACEIPVAKLRESFSSQHVTCYRSCVSNHTHIHVNGNQNTHHAIQTGGEPPALLPFAKQGTVPWHEAQAHLWDQVSACRNQLVWQGWLADKRVSSFVLLATTCPLCVIP